MNTITIKKLELFNFKGIRNLVIDFKKITDISGKNETGKTTIFDAFTWVLFGKDSTDKSQFDIKTLDENNIAIPKIEHFVNVTLDVNGTEVVLKRLYKEDWVKKKGSLEATLERHKTLYKWNNVPKLANEYAAKINELIDEGIFKLITNPLYFNSLHWEKRRSIVIMVAGDIPDIEIAAGNEEFLKLITGLGEKKIKEYKSELAADRKMLKDELKLIPTRIDEATRSMPEARNFNTIRGQLNDLNIKIEAIDAVIYNKSQALSLAQEKHTEKQRESFAVTNKITQLELNEQKILNDKELNVGKKLTELMLKHDSKKSEVENISDNISLIEENKNTLFRKMNELRDWWKNINAGKFILDINQTVCPTCERELDDVDSVKNTLEQNFNQNKNEKLAETSKVGVTMDVKHSEYLEKLKCEKEKKGELIKELDSLVYKIDSEEKLIEAYQKPELEVYLKDHIEYQKLVKELAKLEANMDEAPTVDTTELTAQKVPIQKEIDELKLILNDENIIIKTEKRIKELEEQESNLAQQISELEKIEFTIENFDKEKAHKLESKINAKFKYAKFKLFEQQINGGQIPCCETIYKGVPYPSLNNAATINIGIDIINTLCEFHDVSAPIFCDNAEAVNELTPTKSQMIRLIVTTDKELKIT